MVWISYLNINVYKRGFKFSTTLDFPSFPFTFLPITKMLFTAWIKVEDRLLSEISQAQKENAVRFHLMLEVPREAKFTERESRRGVVCPGLGKGRRGLFKAGRVSVWKMKKFWKWMVVVLAQHCDSFNATELHTCQFGVMYILPQ